MINIRNTIKYGISNGVREFIYCSPLLYFSIPQGRDESKGWWPISKTHQLMINS